MRIKFRALGLALVAALAMSAVIAQAAQAHKFVTDTGAPAFVTGELEPGAKEGFSVSTVLGTASVECTTANSTIESVSNESETIREQPAYSGCEFLGVAANIDMNGCEYVYHGATPVANMALMDVECPGTNKIRFTAPNVCDLTVGTQTGLSGVKYTNIAGPPMKITVTRTVSGAAFTKDAPTGTDNCSLITGTTMNIGGSRILTGFTNSSETTTLGITFQ